MKGYQKLQWESSAPTELFVWRYTVLTNNSNPSDRRSLSQCVIVAVGIETRVNEVLALLRLDAE
jgi:hypothetical protein